LVDSRLVEFLLSFSLRIQCRRRFLLLGSMGGICLEEGEILESGKFLDYPLKDGGR